MKMFFSICPLDRRSFQNIEHINSAATTVLKYVLSFKLAFIANYRCYFEFAPSGTSLSGQLPAAIADKRFLLMLLPSWRP